MFRIAKRPLFVMAVTFILAAVLIISYGNQHIAAGAMGEGSENFLPLVRTEEPLTSVTMRPEIDGIGADTTIAITHAGDSRLFIATQYGIVHVVQRNPQTFAPGEISVFLNIQDQLHIPPTFEEGMLGLVFHPDYDQNGLFYISYTQKLTGRIILARYQVSADPNVADPNSRFIMLAIEKPPNAPGVVWPPWSPVHNAGDLHFGADGYLYMATGDGGPDPFQLPIVPGDPNNNAQRLDTLLGKLLRIDVDQHAGLAPDCGGAGYTIPVTNPFADGPGGSCDENWSYGWRNPWRFSFDTATGDMYIGDVGEWRQEEVNFEPAGLGGRNYGWHCFEGTYDHRDAPHLAGQCSADASVYTFPFLSYGRDQGISVIGGYVYRGNRYQPMRGHYLFADFSPAIPPNPSKIWAVDVEDLGAGAVPLEVTIDGQRPQWTALGYDVNGELYIGGFLHNVVYHITVP